MLMIELDEIRLAHGDGGRLSHQLIENIFLPAFGNNFLDSLDKSPNFVDLQKLFSIEVSSISSLEKMISSILYMFSNSRNETMKKNILKSFFVEANRQGYLDIQFDKDF